MNRYCIKRKWRHLYFFKLSHVSSFFLFSPRHDFINNNKIVFTFSRECNTFKTHTYRSSHKYLLNSIDWLIDFTFNKNNNNNNKYNMVTIDILFYVKRSITKRKKKVINALLSGGFTCGFNIIIIIIIIYPNVFIWFKKKKKNFPIPKRYSQVVLTKHRISQASSAFIRNLNTLLVIREGRYRWPRQQQEPMNLYATCCESAASSLATVSTLH